MTAATRTRLEKRLERLRVEVERLAEAIAAIPDEPTLDLVDTAEVAVMAGVARNTVQQWWGRGLLPAPIGMVGQSRVWDRQTISEWLVTREG